MAVQTSSLAQPCHDINLLRLFCKCRDAVLRRILDCWQHSARVLFRQERRPRRAVGYPVLSRMARAAALTDSASSTGAKTLARPPQLRTQRWISARLDSFK